MTQAFVGPTPMARPGASRPKRKAASWRPFGDERDPQFSGVFLPFLYTDKVIEGFFNSPLGSNVMAAVTPL